MELRGKLMTLLQEESELQEIVNLVGMDALSAPDRLKLETSRSIREDYLHQNAFDPTDTYTSLGKQVLMMRAILAYYDKAKEALANGADIEMLVNLPVRERIGRYNMYPRIRFGTSSSQSRLCLIRKLRMYLKGVRTDAKGIPHNTRGCRSSYDGK